MKNYFSKLWFLFRHLSVVHSSFKYDKGFKIGYFCVIESGCEVGSNVTLQNFVLFKKGTKIGSNVCVDSYVRSSGDNAIGNNVTLRFGSTIARKVFVNDGVFISPNVMTIYSKHTGEKSEGTYIGNDAFIGTAVVLGPNITIGKGVTIGAMAYVSKNCLEEGVYVGVPAKKV